MSDRGIAAVGDIGTVLGLGALGIKSFVLEDGSQAEAVERSLIDGDFAVVLVTEAALKLLPGSAGGLEKKSVVVPIISCRTRQPLGLKSLEKLIERAIGIAGLMDKSLGV